MKELKDGSEFYLLEKYSNRLVSRPNASLTIENDGRSNVCFILHKTDKPYVYKIENKEMGKYMESVFGTTRWQEEADRLSQEWMLWLEEDGYYRIENLSDGVCLSVSGNTTEAGTALYLSDANASVHQSFGLYFDSQEHPDYEEADMFSKGYRESNREIMKEQTIAAGIHDMRQDDDVRRIYKLITGLQVSDCPLTRGLYIEIKNNKSRKILVK